jgi:hypothetical protein
VGGYPRPRGLQVDFVPISRSQASKLRAHKPQITVNLRVPGGVTQDAQPSLCRLLRLYAGSFVGVVIV